MAVDLTTLLQGRHHIMVDLDRMDHETQKPRRVLSWIHRRYSTLVLTETFPCVLNLLDIVIGC